MKKLYSLLILVFIGFVGNAQIVNIPDANFKAKLLSATTTNYVAKNLAGNFFKIDANNDSQIQVSEAAQVSYLDLTSASITSIVGITSFTNLISLNCSSNNFTTLTIDGLPLLNNLIVAPNSSLTTLNINHLPSLTTFSVFGSFSDLDNLVTLDCSNNALTVLDLYDGFNSIASIKNVNCSNNNITLLDIGNAQLLQLNASNNDLTSISTQSFAYDLMTSLDISINNFATFVVNGPLISTFVYHDNPLVTLTFNRFSNTAINITNLSTLLTLNIDGFMTLPSVSFSLLPNLNLLLVRNATINSDVTVANLPNLKILRFLCPNTNLTMTGTLGFTQLQSNVASSYIDISANIFHITNISSITNIDVAYFRVKTITIDNMPNVTYLNFPYSEDMTAIQLSSLPLMVTLNIGFSNSDINTNCINLAIQNFPALTTINLKKIRFSALTLNTLPALTTFVNEGISCSTTTSSLTLTNLPLLYNVKVLDDNLASLSVTNLNSLHDLEIFSEYYTSVTMTSLPQLYNFKYTLQYGSASVSLPALNIQNLPNLYSVYLSRIQISALNLLNLPNLYNLTITNDYPSTQYIPNTIPYIISNLPNLHNLQLDEIVTTNLSMTNLPMLDTLRMRESNIGASYTFQNLPMQSLFIDNMDTLFTISFNNLSTFKNLSLLDSSKITSINFGNVNTSLETFNLQTTYYIPSTSIQTLNFTNFPNLTSITAKYSLTGLVMSNLPALHYLDCSRNKFNSLAVGPLPNLDEMVCNYDSPTSSTFLLTLNNLPLLTKLNVNYCNGYLKRLDFAQCPAINELHFLISNSSSTGTIQYINLKNGNSNFNVFESNPVTTMCVDTVAEKTLLQSLNPNIGNTIFTNYCTFAPGGAIYTLQGNDRFDSNGNGCDASDIAIPTLGFSINDGTFTNNFFANTSGVYSIALTPNLYTITPFVENPTYFNVLPSSISVNFPTQASPMLQDVCVTANGVHNDLEITILPVVAARPNTNATYKISYKNKGTSVQSGTVNLVFEDAKMDLVSATPINTGSSVNTLNWSFANLQPFESREILVVMNINSPTETPAVNSGDVLYFTADVAGATDESPTDNTSVINQSVVNSLDPNVKVCLEGIMVSPAQVGKYVHYFIHFENTGTANATNIVVKDIIDTAKYDINSLVPLNGSASYVTRLSSPNQVEFIFQNINLPFNDVTNDGYVSFKIKTKSTLVIGDTFSNNANIYFDYNPAIVTNTAITIVSALGIKDFDFNSMFTLSPVPAGNILTLTNKQGIVISSASIYNTLGQLIQVSTNPNETIDVSGLKAGTYFIKVISDKGTASSKFIKE